MKKTILAALAVLTFVSPASALELPDGLTCTDLFWHTKGGINKKHLSDYDECVIATNWPDKEFGVLNNIAWVKIEDHYYSMSINVMRKSFGSAEQAMGRFIVWAKVQHNNRG